MANKSDEESCPIFRRPQERQINCTLRLADRWINQKAALVARGLASAALGIGHHRIKFFRRLGQEGQISQCLALGTDHQNAPFAHLRIPLARKDKLYEAIARGPSPTSWRQQVSA
jgi:hypothetical protein